MHNFPSSREKRKRIEFKAFLCATALLFFCCWNGNGAESIPFQWSWIPADAASAPERLELKVAPGYYLYRDAITITLTPDQPNATETHLELPPGEQHFDPLSEQTVAVYPGNFQYQWDLPRQNYRQITVDFQGCSEASENAPGLCFMPETLELLPPGSASSANPPAKSIESPGKLPQELIRALADFEVLKVEAGLMNAPTFLTFLNSRAHDRSPSPQGELAGEPISAETQEASDLAQKGFWGILALVLLGGLGLNFTPCVLPMIPVNLAIIGAGSEAASKWVGFRRGAAYGLGITLAYGTLGVLAALTGSRFGTLNSSWVFNAVIAVVFVVLALALWGKFFNLDLSRFDRFNMGKMQKFPPEITAFVMGIVAALLAGACVAPVVISVVVLAAKLYSEGMFFGILLPFALGLAMALPWPLAGAGLAILPEPGKYMNTVKKIMALVILAAGCYFGYLAWNLRFHDFDGKRELKKLTDTLQQTPLQQIVLIDFYASWCKNCHAMEQSTFQNAEVQQALQSLEFIKFQAENLNDPAIKALLDLFDIPGLPAFVLLQKKD